MKALDIHIKDKKVYRKLNDSAIYCQACDERVHIKDTAVKHCITSHEKSKKHVKNHQVWLTRSLAQTSIVAGFSGGHQAIDQLPALDLAAFLNACNIPWKKVNSKPFKNFFNKLGKKVPDESTLRRQLPKLYESTIVGIREYIGNEWIYIQVDEARIADRAIVSVLVGRLDGAASDSHCINIVETEHQIDSVSIVQIVNDSLNILWPQQSYYDKFRLLVSDQAAYMTKAGKDLNCLYPKLIHVTCLCHALHRVSEQVHSDKKELKKFVEKFCKVLSRSKRRQNKLSYAISAPLHSLPVVTRWGTWLSFCGFLHSHFDKIKEFIAEIEDEDNQAIATLVELSNDMNIREQLIEVYQLQFLVNTIKSLEDSGLTIYKQKQLLSEAKQKMPSEYQSKLESSLAKNPGFEQVFNTQSHEEANKYVFAPLCSVDVERSFSKLKNILTDRRQSFTAENFKFYSVSHLYHSKQD